MFKWLGLLSYSSLHSSLTDSSLASSGGIGPTRFGVSRFVRVVAAISSSDQSVIRELKAKRSNKHAGLITL